MLFFGRWSKYTKLDIKSVTLLFERVLFLFFQVSKLIFMSQLWSIITIVNSTL